jgi:hypothetical protein
MVLLKPQVVIAGALGKGAVSREQLAAAGIQLVAAGGITWSKKPFFLRNVPVTAVSPSPAQRAVRGTFGRIAAGAFGSKGLVEGLPQAAARIRRARGEIRSAAAGVPHRTRKRGTKYLQYLAAPRAE